MDVMNDWISVDDKLPDKEKCYKILIKGKIESYGYFYNGNFIKFKGIKIDNVTHWKEK